MKKFLLPAFAIVMTLSALGVSAQEERIVLIKAKLVSKNTYLIVARGYPKEGSKMPVESAKDAAVFNAQLLAKERFNDSFDVIINGKATKFIKRDGCVDVHYLLTSPNIKKQLRKK